MTLDRRRRRSTDIFDTGLGQYQDALLRQAAKDYAAANPTINPTDSPELYQTTTALDNKIAEFNGNMDAPTTEEYEGYTIKRYGGGKWPSKKYMFVIYDPSGTMVEVLLSSNWVAVSAEKKKFIDDRAGTAFVPNQESVAAGLVADLTSVQGVVWSYEKGLIEYATAYNTLMNSFSMSDNDINDILTYEATALVQEYEETYDRAAAGEINYNPQVPTSEYEIGEYIVPNVGQATMHNQTIPTNKSYKYWDGELATHDWGLHGSSTPFATNVKDRDANGNKPLYPKPIVDSYGGYAVSLSHYMASYGSDGSFLGFRVLSASEVEGGVPAGIPIATVMQFFTKPARKEDNILGVGGGKDWPLNGRNFMLDTEKKPIWRKAQFMTMKPESFFLCEKDFAEEYAIEPDGGGRDGKVLYENLTGFTNTDLTKAYDSAGDVPSVFGTMQRQRTLDRQVKDGSKFWTLPQTSKVNFAAKVEWLGEDNQFGAYSTHPTSIPDCNEQGKTMVIYRFPRQLDAEVDKELIRFYSENGLPNYEITATGECYPFPVKGKVGLDGGFIADNTKFGLIGRLAPEGADDSIGAEKFETTYNGKPFAGRRKISFLPMISPYLPPSDQHRPYVVTGTDYFNWAWSTLGRKAYHIRRTDWFCFDTASVRGAGISVTDPYKKAFLGSSRLTNAYFPQADLDVGSSAFAIGQCMLAYDLAKPSVDSNPQMREEGGNLVNLPHSSERIILTVETDRMNSVRMREKYGAGFMSDELLAAAGTPLPTRDGSAAGDYKSDYLPPMQIITTDDLILMENPPQGYMEPVGMVAIREAWKKTFGTELSAAAFAALPNIGSNDNPNKYGIRDPNNPLRYIISTEYGSFSYPFSIAIFNVPSHFRGPVLKYTEEVDARNNFIPMGPTEDKPGYIGTRPVKMWYQTPFGEVNSSVINLDKQIQRQLDTVVLDDQGNPVEGEVADLFEQQTEEGGLDEGEFEEQEQEIHTEIQFENWLYGRLMEDYGNVRFTDTASKAYFKWWNKDYVTGRMFLEARLPLPGVDLTPYYAEARASNIPITTQATETEEQDQQSAAIAGFGAFTDSSGFTVTDVTAKWGTLGAAKARYTGDIGMSMVPYKANVTNEQLGYLAMSNLDGIENLGSNGSLLDKAVGTDSILEGVGDGFRYAGVGVGGAAVVAGLGLAGSALMFATVSSLQAVKLRKIAEKKAKEL